jgi:hypothetical protein
MAETQDLIARLEKLSGPDRDVDRGIQMLVAKEKHGDEMWGIGFYDSAPAYTGSLDAQKTIAHPDWQVSSGNCNEDNGPWACVTTPDNVDHTGDGAATEELARLIALLKAMGATK